MILPEHEAKQLLQKAQIPVAPTTLIDSMEDARAQAREIGYPVVLKLSTSRFSHKTDVGGVLLNINDDEALHRAFTELSQLRERLDPAAAIIIEPMASPGVELFIGFQRHPGFGPVISLGLGGVWLELVKDVAFRLLPAERYDFQEMLTELKSWSKLRAGFRHLPAVNADKVVDLIESIATFALEQPDVQEMDLNPVMVYPDHALVVDARIAMK